MIQIKTLSSIPLMELFTAFDEAFIDYVRRWTYEEFSKMMKRNGFNPEISFGAFDNERLVSFTLNAIGMFNGVQTAYDTGTGTIKEYRGQGLAGKIFNESVPVLKSEGVEQYLLEVLQNNSNAISVYDKIGFKVSRELNYFVSEISKLKLSEKTVPGIKLVEIGFEHQNLLTQMWDFIPSWQNSFESLQRKSDSFVKVGAFSNKKLVGYGIVEPATGDISQLAVLKEERRRGIGTLIFKELIKRIDHWGVKVINTEKKSTDVTAFIESMNIPVTGSQFEMILKF